MGLNCYDWNPFLKGASWRSRACLWLLSFWDRACLNLHSGNHPALDGQSIFSMCGDWEAGGCNQIEQNVWNTNRDCPIICFYSCRQQPHSFSTMSTDVQTPFCSNSPIMLQGLSLRRLPFGEALSSEPWCNSIYSNVSPCIRHFWVKKHWNGNYSLRPLAAEHGSVTVEFRTVTTPFFSSILMPPTPSALEHPQPPLWFPDVSPQTCLVLCTLQTPLSVTPSVRYVWGLLTNTKRTRPSYRLSFYVV